MMKITSSLLLTAALVAPASSQNLLSNPGFDVGGLAGWSAFGNAFAENANAPRFVPRSNPALVSMFGNFTGSFNVSGVFQAFPASPGQQFTMDCWSRHFSGDALLGNGAPSNNWMVMKIAFFNAANTEIGSAERTILDGTFATDTWIDNAPITGTAPVGTTSVQALLLFLQPSTVGGAGQVDDVDFRRLGANPRYPGTGDDLALATGVGGAPPSSGGGNDVKAAGGGQLLEVRVSSPQGAYDLLPYFVLGQAFTTGSTRPQPFPGVWFDFNQPIVIIVGAFGGPVRGPVIPPGGGSSSFFVTPSGAGGTSVMLQAVVFSSASSNNMFAVSDGHEIQLQ